MDRLLARLDDPEAELEKTSRAIADYLALIAKRHGLFAPTKTEATTSDAEPVPDPEMTLAVQAALAELDAADRKRESGSGS
jgi:hypothetical protein